MEHKDAISFEDFKKLDVRIGTIMSAEAVPETDKLVRLEVDFGEEKPRQIISGIRKFIGDTDDLVGLQSTFVVNLEPRTVRGLESDGMLFAVGGEIFSLLCPDKKVNPGSRVI